MLARLHGEFVSTLKAPEVHSKIDDLGMSLIASTPAEFAAPINPESSSTAG